MTSPPTTPSSGFPPRGQRISIVAASERSGLSTKTLRRWIRTGELRAYRVGKRTLRVDTGDVDALFVPTIPTINGHGE
jgi:excisionase family DNA binding protein